MCELITTCCNNPAHAIVNSLSTFSENLTSYCRSIDRTFSHLTNEILPETTAKVIQQMYRTLPITICFLVAPTPALVSLAVIHIIEFGPVFSAETYTKIAQGIANIPIILALDNTLCFMATQSPIYKEAIVVHLVVATLFRFALSTIIE
jgi:hypothetical protein